MKEKMNTIINKVKEISDKLAASLSKVSFFGKVTGWAKKYRMILALAMFVVVILALILFPVLMWKEFVVPVCVLVVLAVLMAVILHKSEIWIHGVCLLAQLIIGFVIDRVPMVLICMVAYVAATLSLALGFGSTGREVQTAEEPKTEEKSVKENKKKNKNK